MTRFPMILLLTAGLMIADTVNYTYDAVGRLTTVAYGNGTTVSYTYDNAGNLLNRSVTVPNASATPADTSRKDDPPVVKPRGRARVRVRPSRLPSPK